MGDKKINISTSQTTNCHHEKCWGGRSNLCLFGYSHPMCGMCTGVRALIVLHWFPWIGERDLKQVAINKYSATMVADCSGKNMQESG